MKGPGQSIAARLAAAGLDVEAFGEGFVRLGVGRRMRALGLEEVDAYLELLAADPSEAAALSHGMFLNVTGFFRDPAAWEVLAEVVIPQIAAAHPRGRLRLWSAGCCTGEEAYSLAMAAAGALGPSPERIRVLGTDIDEEALEIARRASYGPGDLASIPAPMRRRWAGGGAIAGEIARLVEFSVHDLSATGDYPGGFDLIACRHTLMYFPGDLQARIVDRFVSALRDPGFLFLEETDRVAGSHPALEKMGVHPLYRRAVQALSPSAEHR